MPLASQRVGQILESGFKGHFRRQHVLVLWGTRGAELPHGRFKALQLCLGCRIPDDCKVPPVPRPTLGLPPPCLSSSALQRGDDPGIQQHCTRILEAPSHQRQSWSPWWGKRSMPASMAGPRPVPLLFAALYIICSLGPFQFLPRNCYRRGYLYSRGVE